MREWLEQLAPALRAIFVLRAVAGQDAERTAENLRRSGDVGSQGWQREQVGTAYRQGAVLASQFSGGFPTRSPPWFRAALRLARSA